MPEKLAVAAVAVFPVLLVGRGGGAGAPLRAAVLVLPLLQLRRGVTQRPIAHLVPLTRLIPVRKNTTEFNSNFKMFLIIRGHWNHF